MTVAHAAQLKFWPTPWAKFSTASQKAFLSPIFDKTGVFHHNPPILASAAFAISTNLGLPQTLVLQAFMSECKIVPEPTSGIKIRFATQDPKVALNS